MTDGHSTSKPAPGHSGGFSPAVQPAGGAPGEHDVVRQAVDNPQGFEGLAVGDVDRELVPAREVGARGGLALRPQVALLDGGQGRRHRSAGHGAGGIGSRSASLGAGAEAESAPDADDEREAQIGIGVHLRRDLDHDRRLPGHEAADRQLQHDLLAARRTLQRAHGRGQAEEAGIRRNRGGPWALLEVRWGAVGALHERGRSRGAGRQQDPGACEHRLGLDERDPVAAFRAGGAIRPLVGQADLDVRSVPCREQIGGNFDTEREGLTDQSLGRNVDLHPGHDLPVERAAAETDPSQPETRTCPSEAS